MPDNGGDRAMRESLKKVAVALKNAGIPFALAGGYAGWSRGGPEPEHDVDFVILPGDVDRTLEVLGEAGLATERPPEDWLVKVYDGDVLVDLIFRPVNHEVTPDLLDRAQELSVDSVFMPVLDATDLLVTKLLAFSEQSCDFGKALADARAMREQIDWRRVRDQTARSPYAEAFLFLLDRLGVQPLAD